ncbi:copper resistance protein NlpE [Lysobacter sp. CFH 32150]|uniref:copper resistance protein NlpE n=1 Tax=Lysobacter sp. CFH 32150 TaxID=2927128 RepID=UPI001FA745B8|nr:copper resistance protein NlpE [Lysobacter sp. CFH 32150]MCI4567274.1 copper resistance protein NlpE N-terminal domain-containing protein [Lysobacter sp. CFH 32150]
MNQKLLAIACISLFAVVACKKPEPVETASAPEPAVPAEQAPAPVALESEPARSAADVPFDVKGFAGQFVGMLPCADCPGIDTRVTLNADGTFTLLETYQDRKVKTTPVDGTWSVEADDKHIRLDPNSKAEDDRLYEILSNDEIRLLDQEGKHIESDLPYNLKRGT